MSKIITSAVGLFSLKYVIATRALENCLARQNKVVFHYASIFCSLIWNKKNLHLHVLMTSGFCSDRKYILCLNSIPSCTCPALCCVQLKITAPSRIDSAIVISLKLLLDCRFSLFSVSQ